MGVAEECFITVGCCLKKESSVKTAIYCKLHRDGEGSGKALPKSVNSLRQNKGAAQSGEKEVPC
jgi:hypothetical protein